MKKINENNTIGTFEGANAAVNTWGRRPADPFGDFGRKLRAEHYILPLSEQEALKLLRKEFAVCSADEERIFLVALLYES